MPVALPSPFNAIPRVPLVFEQATEIARLDRLTEQVQCGATFWIKRDDCNSGLAFGGNKIRKLEYVLADALDQGADTIITTGGVQSNHMRQTAAAAARLGLKVALYPRASVESASPEYQYAGNVQLNTILGAETFPVGTSEAELFQILQARGQRPYSIPTGASTHPLGGLGHARWAFEVLQQEKELGIVFDTIIAAVGSGSTFAGMIAGLKLAKKTGYLHAQKHLVGINILEPKPGKMRDLVLEIARNTAEKIGLGADSISEDDFEIRDEFLGGSYGRLDPDTVVSIKELAQSEGILTDPVYTGKALKGMLHMARAGIFVDQNILFCHTGGQSAISAYPTLC